jgi:hypothetical protein
MSGFGNVKLATQILVRELRSAYTTDADFQWDNVGTVLLHAIRLMADVSVLSGPQKKEAVIAALVEVCPNDDVDKLVPPFVDLVWFLVKANRGGTCFGRRCC